MASDINQQINLEKNTQAFKYLCNQLSIIPIVLPRNWIFSCFNDVARDLQHPGPSSYRQLAEKIKSLI
jgi:hypothetical protein